MQKSRSIILIILGVFLAGCTTIGPATQPAQLGAQTLAENQAEIPVLQATAIPTPTRIPTAVPTFTPTPGPTKTPAPATYFHFEAGFNPLTGLPVDNPANLNRRPVMVKVSNWPREGRPHAGLTGADIVFEYFIGHQMNRFLAVYYGDNAGEIGPVRSGRLVDAQLVNLYQGILAYGNADPQVDEVLVEILGERALAFNELSCPAMCGESTHSATGVFANSQALTDHFRNIGVDNPPPDLRGMMFQPEPPVGDANGSLLHIEYADFSVMEWRYNDVESNYHLWMEAQTEDALVLAPITDRNNNQPVTFDNVVVMYAEYIEYAPSLHDILIQDIQDYQPALLFRDGTLTYGTWRVPEPNRPIIFETPGGESLPFKPGNTWIVIVGMNSLTTQPAGGEWEIYFDLP